MPAWPTTRAFGKPETLEGELSHRVQRVGEDDQDAVGRAAHDLLDDALDDPLVGQ